MAAGRYSTVPYTCPREFAFPDRACLMFKISDPLVRARASRLTEWSALSMMFTPCISMQTALAGPLRDSAQASLPYGLFRTVTRSLTSPDHRLHQRGDLERREIGKGVGNRIRQNNPIIMFQGAAGINHVWDIPLALGRFGAN